MREIGHFIGGKKVAGASAKCGMTSAANSRIDFCAARQPEPVGQAH